MQINLRILNIINKIIHKPMNNYSGFYELFVDRFSEGTLAIIIEAIKSKIPDRMKKGAQLVEDSIFQ